MRDEEKRLQLIELLDKKVFDPVLEAMPTQYSSERDRRRLIEVQQTAAQEKEQIHQSTRTAVEVRNHYLQNLYYESSGQTGRSLEDLELPRLKAIRNEFLGLCEELEVE